MTQSTETASLIAAIREAHELLGKHPITSELTNEMVKKMKWVLR